MSHDDTAVCNQFNTPDQEIVLMPHFEHLSNHLSNAEAATALDILPKAANTRYLRAMRRLRELMDNTEGEGLSSV